MKELFDIFIFIFLASVQPLGAWREIQNRIRLHPLNDITQIKFSSNLAIYLYVLPDP